MGDSPKDPSPTAEHTQPKVMPPVWLASAAVASGWAVVFSIARWIAGYLRDPGDVDFRAYYYAARLGLERGWNQIYNQEALRAVVASQLHGHDALVNSSHTYPNAPLLAWIIAPLTILPYGQAYVAWTLIGVVSLSFTWWLASPFQGLARLTMLLVAAAVWPIHYSLVLGQSTPEILALVVGAWWLIRRDRPIAAGLLLAFATGLKPQNVILVPFALLIIGRRRVFLAWCGGCAILAVLFAASLGVSGLTDFWRTTVEVESDPSHHYWTLASIAGPGLPASVLELGSLAAALLVVWRRRSNLELTIAVGLLGSVLSAVHEHEPDASMFVLAGWLVLRAPTGTLSRLWLLPGIIAMQTMSIGLAWPIFAWALIWLLLIGIDRSTAGHDSAQTGHVPAATQSRDEAGASARHLAR